MSGCFLFNIFFNQFNLNLVLPEAIHWREWTGLKLSINCLQLWVTLIFVLISLSKIQQASRAITGGYICIIESLRQKWNIKGYSLFHNDDYFDIFHRKRSIFYLIAKININLYLTFSTFVTWVESGLLQIWKDYGGSHVSVDNSINRGSFSVSL